MAEFELRCDNCGGGEWKDRYEKQAMTTGVRAIIECAGCGATHHMWLSG